MWLIGKLDPLCSKQKIERERERERERGRERRECVSVRLKR